MSLPVRRALTIAGCAAALAGLAAPAASATPSSCHLANGIKHVIYVQFDNTHLLRDNPNVASDLEQMPHLKGFLQDQGSLLSNDHTILISHTAGGITSTLTGLYPDRGGQTVSNSYDYFKPDGTPAFTSSFTYWNDPVSATDTLPNMVNGDGGTPKTTPAPWVPYTRGGCDFGAVGTANIELENNKTSPTGDITTVFGPGSPEYIEASTPSTKAQSYTDFVGIAIHCAKGSPTCGGPNGRADKLPDEPRGYNGYSALFGAKYVNPAITGGQPAVDDLGGQPITDASGHPGFPGFDAMEPTTSLGYVAQMQEAGVPITFAYLSDAHDNHSLGRASGPGEADYVAQLHTYDQAFKIFFNRLAAHGINHSNTLFVFTVDEGDHFAGKQLQGCDGTTTACSYSHTLCNASVAPANCPANQIGEVAANLKALLPTEPKFDIHFDSAPTVYVNGQPDRTDPAVRKFERDVANAKAIDPYVDPTKPTPITNFLADPVAERALHMVNADPLRTPTFTLFANPDYYFTTSAPACGTTTCVDPGFAWNHGDNAPEIGRTWIGIVGPGVRNKGLDGQVWTDHTDVRPTMLSLLGLRDDYADDGRVVLQVLRGSAVPSSLRSHRQTLLELGAVYKQLQAPYGPFGQATLAASTRAVASGSSANDSRYAEIERQIAELTDQRDGVAAAMRKLLDGAAFGGRPIDEREARSLIRLGSTILDDAARLGEQRPG